MVKYIVSDEELQDLVMRGKKALLYFKSNVEPIEEMVSGTVDCVTSLGMCINGRIYELYLDGYIRKNYGKKIAIYLEKINE
jgi:hypothetical protein